MLRLLRSIGFALLALLVAGLAVWAYLRFVSPPVVELTQEQLMAALGPRFPLRSCSADGGACIELSEPALQLVEGSERIDFAARFKASLGPIELPGQLAFSGKLRYDAASGSFFFDDLDLGRLDIDGLPPLVAALLRERGTQGIRARLEQTPVHTLDSGSRRERLARMLLGDVRVQQGRLRIQFLQPGS